MPAESSGMADFEIYCMLCNRPLGDEDDVHFTCGPYGYDIDVMCGECMERTRHLRAENADQPVDAAGLGLNGEPLDLFVSGELGGRES